MSSSPKNLNGILSAPEILTCNTQAPKRRKKKRKSSNGTTGELRFQVCKSDFGGRLILRVHARVAVRGQPHQGQTVQAD